MWGGIWLFHSGWTEYHLLDGGVYDNPDITIQRAMDMVIADLKEPRFSAVTEQYYRDEFLQGEVYAGSEAEIVDFVELSEKAEEVEQADLEAKQAEFSENNLDVVADFRAKTEELFHSLDGQSAEPEHWRLIFRSWKLTCRRRHSRSRSTISLSRRGENWCRNKTHLYQKKKCFLNLKKSL